MGYKICSKCNENKPFSSFNKDKSGKNGLCAQCKDCRHKYRIKNREHTKKYNKQYNKDNVDKIKDLKAKYRENNREKIKNNRREYHLKNKNKCNKRSKDYKLKNKDKIRKYKKDYYDRKYFSDPNFKLQMRLRSRLREVVKGKTKTGSAIRDLGCSIDELRRYIESMFYKHPITGEMMSWDNHGVYGWHIDHVRPLASFDLTDRKQFLQACHYTNLQPLWAEENLKKGSNT